MVLKAGIWSLSFLRCSPQAPAVTRRRVSASFSSGLSMIGQALLASRRVGRRRLELRDLLLKLFDALFVLFSLVQQHSNALASLNQFVSDHHTEVREELALQRCEHTLR